MAVQGVARAPLGAGDGRDGPGIEQAELAYSEDDARALFFGCTLWGGMLDPVRKAVPIPVLDPQVTMTRYAEYLAWSN